MWIRDLTCWKPIYKGDELGRGSFTLGLQKSIHFFSSKASFENLYRYLISAVKYMIHFISSIASFENLYVKQFISTIKCTSCLSYFLEQLATCQQLIHQFFQLLNTHSFQVLLNKEADKTLLHWPFKLIYSLYKSESKSNRVLSAIE